MSRRCWRCCRSRRSSSGCCSSSSSGCCSSSSSYYTTTSEIEAPGAAAAAVAIQDQDQDQDQAVRSIFREIGNNTVNVTVDNDNVLVAVLVALGALTGAIGPAALRTYLDQFMSKANAN